MARTVVAVFESVYIAKKAIWELQDQGYPRDRIDMVMDSNRSLEKVKNNRSEILTDEVGAGANIGLSIGGAMGLMSGLLYNLGALPLHIPLLNSALGTGAMAVTSTLGAAIFLGVIAGGMAGAVLGGMLGLGIPEEEARQYAKNVRRSSVSVMVLADWDAVDGAIEVLTRHNPLEIDEKVIEWEKTGRRSKKLKAQVTTDGPREHEERR